MTIRDDTIKELLYKNATVVMVRQNHASIYKMINELANIGSSIKTTHTEFTKGMKLVYAVAIMMSG